MQNFTWIPQEVKLNEWLSPPYISIAIIASQMRLLDMIEKIYGDSAFSNPVFAEYKRALENIERESKDNLVTCQQQTSFFS